MNELIETVLPSGIVDGNEIFALIKGSRDSNDTTRCASSNISFGEVNIATAHYNAKTTTGKNSEILLNGDFNINGGNFHSQDRLLIRNFFNVFPIL